MLTLNFDVEKEMECPMVWLTSNLLMKMWESRKEKKRCNPVTVRADLEAKVNLLRETRYSESVNIISQLLSNL